VPWTIAAAAVFVLLIGCVTPTIPEPPPPPPPLPACVPGELDDLPDEPPLPSIPTHQVEQPVAPLQATHDEDAVYVAGGGLELTVQKTPLAIEVRRTSDQAVLLRTGEGTEGFAPVAVTRNEGVWDTMLAWWQYEGEDQPWSGTTEVLSACAADDRVHIRLGLEDDGGVLRLVLGPFRAGTARIAASADPGLEDLNRLAFTFEAPEGEHYAGFGERFNSIDQRGRTVWNWAEEGGINPGSAAAGLAPEGAPPEYAWPGGETTAYAPMPWFLSSRGYGLLADTPYPTSFDMASTLTDRWRLEVHHTELSVVIFDGPTPAEALERYTERTGRSLVPRRWMLGPWNMFVGYPQGGLEAVARMFREQDIPSSVTHEWTAILPVGSHVGSEVGISARNERLHELGYRVLSYLQPRVDQDRYLSLWDEADEAGYFIRDPAGDSYLMELTLNALNSTDFLVSIVDFTAEGVGPWWSELLAEGRALGYDGWMYDFGEYVPPDAEFADGRDGMHWHNAYPLIYQSAGADFARSIDDDPEDELAPDYLYYVRSGYAGSQRFTYGMWGGDPEADWSVADGLPASVVGGINAGLSGMPVWGSDIGGFHAIFVPAPTSELHKRWVQFGAFCGLMRDMTAEQFVTGSRIHVLDEPELTAIVRRYQKLRTQLVPYIQAAARDANQTGMPLMRAPLLHFPEDERVWDLDREFLFGPDLYVAPVIEEGAIERSLYLPPGRWVELWESSEYDGEGSGGFRIGGRPIDGGRDLTVDAPINQIPVFVRMGAAIALVDPEVDTFAGAGEPDGVQVQTAESLQDRLHVWAFPDGTTEVVLADGSVLTVAVEDGGVTLERTGGADTGELIAQIVWPESLSPPDAATALSFVPDADPLALEAGSWTWSEQRNAAAVHGAPGQRSIRLAP
jgi:sulfoquinovosidase